MLLRAIEIVGDHVGYEFLALHVRLVSLRVNVTSNHGNTIDYRKEKKWREQEDRVHGIEEEEDDNNNNNSSSSSSSSS